MDDAVLDSEATALATELASGATSALGRARRLLRDSLDRDLLAQMGAEQEEIVAVAAEPDAREGTCAFLEKRPPKFHGP